MKTGGKIVVGLLAVGVVVGGAIALSHVFPGITTTTQCGRLTMDAPALGRYLTAMNKSSGVSQRSSALGMLGKWLHAAFPSCDFGADTTALFVGPGGEIDWQEVVAIIGDKTIGEANADPEVLAALAALGPSREGSAGIGPDGSIGGNIKDITRMWMGAPLG